MVCDKDSSGHVKRDPERMSSAKPRIAWLSPK